MVARMQGRVRLTGRDLAPAAVASVARHEAVVELDADAVARMRGSRAVVQRALDADTPVYGLTTGLGSRVGERVGREDAAAFSLRMVRGRATAVGPPLATEVVRAAMVVRLNGMCLGGAGVSLAVAQGLAALLNASVHPVIPSSGSVGAADLCLLAHVGLALVGEGEVELGGERLPAAAALARAGLAPVEIGPKDGLAICSSSAVSVGAATLALLDARDLLRAAQVAAALSMEGFRANLSPIDPRAVAARPAPGQPWAAAGLRSLLAGGELTRPGVARRLQDPLSFRCASQIHGSLYTALELLEVTLIPELEGAGDNPLVIMLDDELISTGNFHAPALSLALDTTAIAIAQVAAATSQRPARLATARLSGLPAGLTRLGPTRSGVAVLQKTAQSLAVEIRHLATPLAFDSHVGADGVEDDSTNTVQAALRVRDQLERLRLLVALELVCAAQAVDLAAAEPLGAGTAAAHACVRELVAPLADDRPLGVDVERVARKALASGVLLARVGGSA
jgi:histidine ammonia-lyase